MREYAETTANNAGNTGVRRLDELCTTFLPGDGLRDFARYRAEPNVEQLREGFAACRGALTMAIDRLDVRVIPESELAEFETVMSDAIAMAHQRCLGSDHLSEEARSAMLESEQLTREKLAVFVSAQRDKRREVEDERHFTVVNTWRTLIVGALAGGLTGWITSGGLAHLIGRLLRAF